VYGVVEIGPRGIAPLTRRVCAPRQQTARPEPGADAGPTRRTTMEVDPSEKSPHNRQHFSVGP
jgi:hypothetical protein